MRKLLLTSSALVAAASISSYAVADVSVTGAFEWKYTQQAADVTSKDGDSFHTDNEVVIKFTNKTDSGLTVTGKVELDVDGGQPAGSGNTVNDESVLSISGGFGKLVLGGNDGVGDNYGVSSTDLPAEEIYATSTTTTIAIKNSDISGLEGDASKIAYHLPAMGGLTAGISYTDSGAAGSSDTTQVGFKYSMDAAGASITLGGATGTTENSTQDIDSQVLGVKVASGNISAVVSQATYEASGIDEESNGASVQFKVSDGMTFTLHTVKTEDDGNSEEYTNTGAEIAYTIASGLTAYVNVEDYDYKVGTSTGNTADSGTVSKLTIKATF